MIGTSLSYRNLLNTEDPLLSADVILPKLWERGVRSIELRAVPIGGAPEDALRVANILWDYGFQITVHSSCKTLAKLSFEYSTANVEPFPLHEIPLALPVKLLTAGAGAPMVKVKSPLT